MKRDGQPIRGTATNQHGADEAVPLPPWRLIDLPTRGITHACELPGPSRWSPTVVLLHGLAATGALNWDVCLAALGRRFRVVALDHRGHGRGIRAPFTLEDCADDAVALLDALGIDRAIFAGYSMGGPVAQLVWRRHPARVRGLVLCATAAEFRTTPTRLVLMTVLDELGAALSLVPRPVRLHGLRSVLPALVPDPEVHGAVSDALGRHDELAVRTAARHIRQFSSTGWLREVAAPAAVVVTERDQLVPPSHQMRMAGLLPEAMVVPLDGDHFAFVRAREAFTDALVEACTLVAHRSRRWPGRRLRTRLRRRRLGQPGVVSSAA